jgi:hypothetical protein
METTKPRVASFAFPRLRSNLNSGWLRESRTFRIVRSQMRTRIAGSATHCGRRRITQGCIWWMNSRRLSGLPLS